MARRVRNPNRRRNPWRFPKWRLDRPRRVKFWCRFRVVDLASEPLRAAAAQVAALAIQQRD